MLECKTEGCVTQFIKAPKNGSYCFNCLGKMANEIQVKKEIKFLRTREEFGCFANFYTGAGFLVDGVYWPTSEHYYQAHKFRGPSHLFQAVWCAKTAREATVIGRGHQDKVIQEWDLVKGKVMWDAIYAKFSQNPDIKKILVDTGDHVLIEDSPHDFYWGCGRDGTGQNYLGLALMALREILG